MTGSGVLSLAELESLESLVIWALEVRCDQEESRGRDEVGVSRVD